MDILLVEDNEELGQLIFDFVTNSGFTAEWVRSSEDALKKISEDSFKLILLDDKVKAKTGLGFNTKIDLGIVKYNFEVGSGKDHDIWA